MRQGAMTTFATAWLEQSYWPTRPGHPISGARSSMRRLGLSDGSNCEHLGPWRRCELPDLMRESALDSFVCCKPQIRNLMSIPAVVRHRDMLPEDGFGSYVVNRQTLCEGLKAIGRCKLWAQVRTVDHERCVCA